MKRRKADKPHPNIPGAFFVEGFLNQLDKAYQEFHKYPLPLYPYDKETNAVKLPKQIEDELRQLVEKGQKPKAVERVVNLTGAGLWISKEYVDALVGR